MKIPSKSKAWKNSWQETSLFPSQALLDSMAQQTSFDPVPGVTDKQEGLFLTQSF